MKRFLLTLVVALMLPLNAMATAHTVVHVGLNGLVCDFCAQTLHKVFSKQEAVAAVDINLDEKLMTLELKKDGVIDDAAITKLVTDAGYTVTGIHRQQSDAKPADHGKHAD